MTVSSHSSLMSFIWARILAFWSSRQHARSSSAARNTRSTFKCPSGSSWHIFCRGHRSQFPGVRRSAHGQSRRQRRDRKGLDYEPGGAGFAEPVALRPAAASEGGSGEHRGARAVWRCGGPRFPAQPVSSYANSGKFHPLPGLGLTICRMRVLTVLNSKIFFFIIK